jgi:hypothetical protein
VLGRDSLRGSNNGEDEYRSDGKRREYGGEKSNRV